tara:strand:- start:787 stop:1206 length:420 start_codon:yes stop_codon:yes gene_type:complete
VPDIYTYYVLKPNEIGKHEVFYTNYPYAIRVGSVEEQSDGAVHCSGHQDVDGLIYVMVKEQTKYNAYHRPYILATYRTLVQVEGQVYWQDDSREMQHCINHIMRSLGCTVEEAQEYIDSLDPLVVKPKALGSYYIVEAK